MKKRILIIIILFLGGISIFLNYKLRIKAQYISSLEEKILYLDKTNEMCQNREETFIKNLYLKFNNEVMLTNYHLDLISMIDELGDRERLCLYFSEEMCSPCVEAQIEQFKIFAKKYGTDHLCFFINLQNQESLANINQRYMTKIPFYYINKDLVPFENIMNKPVVFLLDELLFTKACYFPEGELSKLDDMYYESIEKIFN